SPRLSPDGSVVAYETGVPTVKRLVAAANRSTIAELPGSGAVFSLSGKKLAYLKLGSNDELKKAQADLEAAGAIIWSVTPEPNSRSKSALRA
ncbi:MAG: hypothetical protein AAB401_09190, partial [Acidobacteriota bacterium]